MSPLTVVGRGVPVEKYPSHSCKMLDLSTLSVLVTMVTMINKKVSRFPNGTWAEVITIAYSNQTQAKSSTFIKHSFIILQRWCYIVY